MEIETKWLLNGIPDSKVLRMENLSQYYIGAGIRIRSIDDSKFLLTVKSSTSNRLVRKEDECEISENVFRSLIEKSHLGSIKKMRLYIEDDITVDVFQNPKIILAEREFDSVEDLKMYNPPQCIKDVLDRDVSIEKEYKNEYIANHNLIHQTR